MRRMIGGLLVVPAVLFVAEIRLSRSDPVRIGRPETPLWERAQPPGRPSPSPVVTRSERGRGLTVTYPDAANCATLISTDPNSLYTLTSVENGVRFDIDADGDLEQVAWTEPGTDVAFLALDRDGDGRITSGRELIGDHTLPGVTSFPRALVQLSDLPERSAHLDSDNPLFAKLLLWRDANHNGISEAGELQPAEGEISMIGLGYERHRRIDSHGNQSRVRGFVQVRTAPGKNMAATAEDDHSRTRQIYDVCLVAQ